MLLISTSIISTDNFGFYRRYLFEFDNYDIACEIGVDHPQIHVKYLIEFISKINIDTLVDNQLFHERFMGRTVFCHIRKYTND